MGVALSWGCHALIEDKKSKTLRADLCFLRRAGVTPSWWCHAHFQGAKLKLRSRTFFWCCIQLTPGSALFDLFCRSTYFSCFRSIVDLRFFYFRHSSELWRKSKKLVKLVKCCMILRKYRNVILGVITYCIFGKITNSILFKVLIFWFGGILSRKLTNSLTRNNKIKPLCFFSRPKETSWNYMWSLQHRNRKFCNGIEIWKEHLEDYWSFDWWCLLYGKQYTLILSR